jgi:hypothetical protein
MNDHRDNDLHAVERLLRSERPTPTNLELDRMRRRVAAGDRPGARVPRRAAFLRSRAALTSMLAVGLVMSLGGTGLAVSGISSNGSAGIAQYTPGGGGGGGGTPGTPTPGTPTPGTPTEPGTLPGVDTPPGGELGEEQEAPAAEGEVQARQIEQEDAEELPFTGFAAIPLILAGLALLATGTALRRRLPERS